MNRAPWALAATAAIVILLSGCSGGTDSPQASTPAAATGGDVTADVQDAVGGDLAPLVSAAEETEEGRIEVGTSITDPRTDDSDEASDALAICEAVAAMPGITYVSVLEADGTTFALFGHPSVPEGTCGEV